MLLLFYFSLFWSASTECLSLCPCLCCLILFCLSVCWSGGLWLGRGYCWPCEWFHPTGVGLLASCRIVLGTWPPLAMNVANFLFHYKADAHCFSFFGLTDITHTTFHIIQIYAKNKFPPSIITVEQQSRMKLLRILLFWTLSQVKKQRSLFQNPLPLLSNDLFWVRHSFLQWAVPKSTLQRWIWGRGVTMVEFRGENYSSGVFFCLHEFCPWLWLLASCCHLLSMTCFFTIFCIRHSFFF